MNRAALFCLVPFAVLCAATVPARKTPVPVREIPWVSLMDPAGWQLTKAYRMSPMWGIVDSALQGNDSWIGNELMLGDFALEGEFLYNGKNQGGVVLRGDRESWLPWLSGYEMDIDAADLQGEGHITFPGRPQPNPGEARFPVGQWQRFSVRAIGLKITVVLNGRDTIRFTDDHYRYGRICLEGEKGGVRYRNLKVRRFDKKPPQGPRSAWTELFDSAGTGQWETSGSVTVENGVMIIDGTRRRSGATLHGQGVADGSYEFDVWCRGRTGQSRAPYYITLRTTGARAGMCFACRPDFVRSEGFACRSEFPGFMPTTAPEYWRFDLHGKTVDAYRFGDKVLSCTDSAAAPGTIAVAADSCILKIRGVRYRPPAAVARKK